MTIAGGYDDIRSGCKWIGTEGWVWVDREKFNVSNPEWKKGKSLPEELRKVKLYDSPKPPAEFSRLRQVAPANDHAGANGPSLGDSRPSRLDLHARRAENPLGCQTR